MPPVGKKLLPPQMVQRALSTRSSGKPAASNKRRLISGRSRRGVKSSPVMLRTGQTSPPVPPPPDNSNFRRWSDGSQAVGGRCPPVPHDSKGPLDNGQSRALPPGMNGGHHPPDRIASGIGTQSRALLPEQPGAVVAKPSASSISDRSSDVASPPAPHPNLVLDLPDAVGRRRDAKASA